MDAVMLVEALDVHGHVNVRQRITGAGNQCLIGRSLSCEVVLDDPYVAPEHARLTLLEDGRVLVQDLGTRNGTRINGRRIDAESGETIANGQLLIGRTQVRVRSLEATVTPERMFRRDLLRRHRTLLAVAGLVLCFAFAAFTQWTEAPEHLAPRVLIAELVAFSILAAWVALWALVSRLTVGAWQLRIHLAIAAACVGLWAWGYWIYTAAAFALQWKLLWMIMACMAAGVALAAAYLHVRNATHFRRAVSALLAVLAPLICGGVWWLVDLQLDPRTVNHLAPHTAIYPPSLRLAPSMDLNDYLLDVAALKRSANRNRQASLLETPILDADE
ncbi:MAG: FHA domain-containing protein [Pseudomonadota bacterium]